MELVEKANADDPAVQIDVRTLDQALVTVPAGTVTTWNGELRSGARANLLMNVTSARMDIKAAAARAERALERYAEPFRLAWTSWPEDFLDVADAGDRELGARLSLRLLRRSRLGPGARALRRGRAGGARARSRGVRADARESTPRGAVVAANPSPFPRDDLIEADVQVPGGVGSGVARARRRHAAPTQARAERTGQLHPRRARPRSGAVEAPLPASRGLRPLAQRLHDRRGPTLRARSRHGAGPLWLDVAAVRSEIEAPRWRRKTSSGK